LILFPRKIEIHSFLNYSQVNVIDKTTTLLLDKEGMIIAVNRTAARRHQRTPEELIGTHRFDILPENVRESRKAHFEKVLQTGEPEEFEDVRDGIEASKRIKNHQRLSNIPAIIMVTACGRETEVRGQRTEDGKEDSALSPQSLELPIIAMTAHAMAGDEEKSLQAGMNGHVTKPIDPDQLFSTLHNWIKPGEERAAAPELDAAGARAVEEKAVSIEAELPQSLAGFDLADGFRRLQGNQTLYRKLLLNFGTDYDTAANAIRAALDAQDFDHAHSLVHNLKGLAGNLAATELQAAAVNLVKLVKDADKKDPASEQLNLRFVELVAALDQALQSVQSLGIPAEKNISNLTNEELADIPTEFSQDIAKRIRTAAEMGDVMALNAIAEEIKAHSNSCVPLSKQIVQMAEDFDLDGIQKLADVSDGC
jgi:CheY-like chemotaxis protein